VTSARDSQTPSTPPSPPRTVKPVSRGELERLIGGTHHNPHGILGPHPHDGGVTVRTLKPLADSVVVESSDGARTQLRHEFEGVWVGVLPTAEVPDYRIHVAYGDGIVHVHDDPYRFLPTLGEVDLHLIGEGRHEQLWSVLGAHVRDYDGPMGPVRGTSFAVWAPNARAIRIVGDFNRWDGSVHPMRSLGSSGVWELYVPDVTEGNRYKFEILGSDGSRRTKADPMARATEKPPATASMVTSTEYEWQDSEWMTSRSVKNPHNGPMSVYEVHLGSWRQGEGYRDLAEDLVNYVKDLGFTHIELMPVMEHPYGPSWGYQVTSYYAPTSRFGSPDDFRYLVDTLHRNGIGVLLDWVPAHFPKDAFALARFDGQELYEHPDTRRGNHPDWGTLVFDFGRPQVRNFLVANATYWLEEFHIDGLRVDAVASMLYLDYSREAGEWVPNIYGGRENLEAVRLLQETNATVYRRVPGTIMIAEESTSWPGVTRPTHLGGLGFGLKWNMGWMHDSLGYVANAPIHRQYHHHQVTFSMMYAWSENFVLPVSHDEVVHGKGSLLRKMPGDRWQQLANVRAYLAYMWSHPGKQLVFMGAEFAQESEWADGRSLDWWLLDQPAHYGIHALVKDLNSVYRSHPAMWELDHAPEGFQWIDANDAAGNTFSFLRFGSAGPDGVRPTLASVANFSGGPHYNYRLGLPHAGQWNEVLNTDAECYGGSGVGNLGSVHAEALPWHGQPYSALLTVPPLGAVWLEPAVQIEPPEPAAASTHATKPATIETATNATATTEAGTVEAGTVEPGKVTT
jgi:1,4-alpha-glucan branching enzyme